MKIKDRRESDYVLDLSDLDTINPSNNLFELNDRLKKFNKKYEFLQTEKKKNPKPTPRPDPNNDDGFRGPTKEQRKKLKFYNPRKYKF